MSNKFDLSPGTRLQSGQKRDRVEREMAIVKELFRAYFNSELPFEGGYILTSLFDENSTYSRYEITSYNNVKDIYPSSGNLVFQADGKKLFVLVEPANYPRKYTEPSLRESTYKIPYRSSEVHTLTSRRQDRIMIGKKPVITYTSFTVLKPTGDNFAYIFFDTRDLVTALHKFFIDTLWKDANVPKVDSEKAAGIIRDLFPAFIEYKIE
jgi:hypothetical protein